MPCSTPRNTTAAAVTTARLNSLGLFRRRVRSPLTSISRTATTNTIAPSTQIGRILQRPGQEQQHHADRRRRGQVRQLAAPAGGFDHGGLGRAAVDDEGAA